MTTQYIDMTKVSNEATLIVEDGALKTTGSISTVSGELSVAITTNPVPMSESWRGTLTQDEAAGSDKLFTVPAATEWQILSVWAELTSGGVSGNRQVGIQILDSESDVTGRVEAGATQASGITRNYLFAPGLPDLIAFRDTDLLLTPFPPTFILAAGEGIRVWDNKVIASGLDTLNVQLRYAYRSV